LTNRLLPSPKWRVGYANTGGVAEYKQIQLQDIMIQNDIFIVAETHWKPNVSNSFMRQFNIDLRRHDIPSGLSRGLGGVAVFLKSEVQSQVINKIVDPNGRWFALEFTSFILVSGYFEPSYEIKYFKEFSEELLKFTKPFIVVGDFNCRVGRFNNDHLVNVRGRYLLSFMNKYAFQYITPVGGHVYTNIDHKGGTSMVDQLWCSSNYGFPIALEVLPSIVGSTHKVLQMAIEPPIAVVSTAVKVPLRWNLSKLALSHCEAKYKGILEKCVPSVIVVYNDIINEVQNLSFTNLNLSFRTKLINKLWLNIKKNINIAANQSCGKLSQCNIIRYAVDYNLEIGNLNDSLVSAHASAILLIQNRSAKGLVRAAWKKVSNIRCSLRKLMQQRKGEVFQRTVDLLANSKYYSTFQKKTSRVLHSAQSNTRLLPYQVSDYAKYLSTTFGALPTGQCDDYIDDLDFQLSGPISLISLENIKKFIKEIPNGKASGIDGVPGELIKSGGDAIIIMCQYLFSLCKYLQCIPKDWKLGLVIPIFKNKGVSTDVKNFRPITVTCAFRRLYEKIIFADIKVNVDDLLLPTQFGFRPGRSVMDPLIIMNELLHRYPSLKVVLLDISAAYDSIDRRILWKKCEHEFGLSSNQIAVLKSLNEYNFASVSLNGIVSARIPMLRGLIQGSSISPFLFNMFINDLIRRFNLLTGVAIDDSKKINNLLFADDAAVFHTNTVILQRLVNIAESWGKVNGLSFAPAKSEILASNNCNIMMYNINISQSSVVRYLGLFFNCKGIDWNKSIESRLIKSKKLLQVFRSKGMHAGGWRPAQGLLLYKTFIRPIIEFGTYIMILPNNVINELQKIQNEALRAILSLPSTTSIVALHVAFRLPFLKDRNVVMVNKALLKMSVNINRHKFLTYSLFNGNIDTSSVFHISNWRHNSLIFDTTSGVITSLSIDHFYVDSWINHKLKTGRIGNQMPIPKLNNIDYLLMVAPMLPRSHIYLYNQWRFGRIACYGFCYHCRHSTDRLRQSHAVICTKANLLLSKYANDWGIHVDNNYNDIFTNILFEVKDKWSFIISIKLFRVLTFICVKTMNWRRKFHSFDNIIKNCQIQDKLYTQWIKARFKFKKTLYKKKILVHNRYGR
jgi:hypothetical protein